MRGGKSRAGQERPVERPVGLLGFSLFRYFPSGSTLLLACARPIRFVPFPNIHAKCCGRLRNTLEAVKHDGDRLSHVQEWEQYSRQIDRRSTGIFISHQRRCDDVVGRTTIEPAPITFEGSERRLSRLLKNNETQNGRYFGVSAAWIFDGGLKKRLESMRKRIAHRCGVDIIQYFYWNGCGCLRMNVCFKSATHGQMEAIYPCGTRQESPLGRIVVQSGCGEGQSVNSEVGAAQLITVARSEHILCGAAAAIPALTASVFVGSNKKARSIHPLSHAVGRASLKRER